MEIAPVHLEPIRLLYEQGQYVQALRLADTLGPLKQWSGTAARILAGRMAGNLGAPRLGHVLHQLAWRSDPRNPEAIYFHAIHELEHRGPLAAWESQERVADLADATPTVRAGFHALRARTFACFRDFDTAETWQRRAEALAPGDPWVMFERSRLLEGQDRLDDALQVIRQSLELRPWYRPCVQQAAELLQTLSRPDEALELLTEANQRLESSAVAIQMAVLHRDRGHHDACEHWLARAAELAPLAEPGFNDWFTFMQSDTACSNGNLGQAEALNQRYRTRWFRQFAESMPAQNPAGRRYQLPVEFVAQHYQTCVPATITAICRHWGIPVAHLQVADEICYDGTPNHNERRWATTNGCVAREFTVSWGSALALIDRGIPFTLMTATAASSHLQAVIGYDSRKGTWLLRDPSRCHVQEVYAEQLIAAQRRYGPRGMALVPVARADLMASIDLPDAEFYDLHHQLQLCLVAHDRPGARQACEQLAQLDPNHRLTLAARLSLARYDADPVAQLKWIDELLVQFPMDAGLVRGRVYCLRILGRKAERQAMLEKLLADGCDPIIAEEYAQELSEDARHHAPAARMLRRSIQAYGYRGEGYFLSAHILWRQRHHEKATAFYRFAACLDDKDERFAQTFFRASRYLRRTEDALKFLRNRFNRFGSLSGQPARTLYRALEDLNRNPEGLAVIEEAIRLRPDDGDLLLFATYAYSACGRLDIALERLEQARPLSHRIAWLRCSATLSERQGRFREALTMWREVAETEPLANDAHEAVVRLLTATDGAPAAAAYLDQITERFPHSYPIHQLRIQSQYLEPAAAERVARHLIEIDASDVRARRRLALALEGLQRPEEALVEADTAVQLDPSDPYSVELLGDLAMRAGKSDQAREAFEKAVRLSVDQNGAIDSLMTMCRTDEERRRVLAFVHHELVSQVVFGSGLMAFATHARNVLAPDELLEMLREAQRLRPDLWQSWAVVTRQLVHMKRAEEALEIAGQATETFPLTPDVWQELAWVHEALGRTDDRIQALQQALDVQPGHPFVARELARIHSERGDLEESSALLANAAARNPLDAVTLGCLADIVWRQGRRDEAIEHIRRAVLLDPGFEWAWDRLEAWGSENGHQDAAVDVARELVRDRMGDSRAWFALARQLGASGQLDERVAALRQVISLNPSSWEAYDLLAVITAEAGHFEEALAACRPSASDGNAPFYLQGREAWVTALRGDLAAAVAMMKRLVERDPDYPFGWYHLMVWSDKLDQADDCVHAAEQLLRLDSGSAKALGFRGKQRLARGEREAAVQDFTRALELDPGYSYAGYKLAKLQMAAGDHAAARTTIEILRPGAPADAAALDLHLAVKEKRWADAGEHLKTTCAAGTPGEHHLPEVVEMLKKAKRLRQVRKILAAAFETAEITETFAEQWARYCALRIRRGRLWRMLELMRDKSEAGWLATAAYVHQLGETKKRSLLKRFIRKYGERLATQQHTWYHVGLALVDNGCYRSTIRWMANWQTWSSMTPSQLLPLAVGLREERRDDEAARISEHALSLRRDYLSWIHDLWLALDDAFAGRAVAGAERLARIPPPTDNRYYQCMRLIVAALVAMQLKVESDRYLAFDQAREKLSEVRRYHSAFMRKQSDLRRLYRRAVARIARQHGGIGARLWAFWMRAAT